MKNKDMKFVVISLFIVFICQLFITPVSTAKYTEKKSKTLTINAVQPTYTVVFHANNGTNTTISQTFTYKTAQNLRKNTFTKGTEAFIGWSTNSDGSGTQYEDEQNVINLTNVNNGVIDLYAIWTTKIARIGSTYYDTLAEAVTVANNSSEQVSILLLRDTSENITLNASKSAIIDLNGRTVSNNGNANTFSNNGTLVLKNGNVYNNAETNGAINNNSGATITLDGVNVTVKDIADPTSKGRQALYNNSGTATIKGGSNLSSVTAARAAVSNINNSTMTILDATITSYGHSGIDNANSAVLILGTDDGEIDESYPCIIGKKNGIQSSNKLVQFYDGVLKGQTDGVNNINNFVIFPEDNRMLDKEETIDDVLYYEKYVGVGHKVTFNAMGGSIPNDKKTKWIGTDRIVGVQPTATKTNYDFIGWYTAEYNGYKVEPNDPISQDITLYAHYSAVNGTVQVGDVKYNTVQEAINSANDNEPIRITLTDDISASVTVSAGKEIEFDFGEYTISNSGNNAIISNDGIVTIVGGNLLTTADTAGINHNSGTLNITGGNLVSNGTRQVIYITGGVVNISGDAYISSTATGKPQPSALSRGAIQVLPDGELNVTGGTIIGVNQYGIANEGITTIGNSEDDIDATSPVIEGNTDGIRNVGTLNFYDGIIRGKDNAINGDVTDQVEGAIIIDGTDGDFKTAHLELMENLNNNSMQSFSSNLPQVDLITGSNGEPQEDNNIPTTNNEGEGQEQPSNVQEPNDPPTNDVVVNNPQEPNNDNGEEEGNQEETNGN